MANGLTTDVLKHRTIVEHESNNKWDDSRHYLDIVEMVSCLSRVGIQSLKSTRKGIGHLQIIPPSNNSRVYYTAERAKRLYITLRENFRKVQGIMIYIKHCIT